MWSLHLRSWWVRRLVVGWWSVGLVLLVVGVIGRVRLHLVHRKRMGMSQMKFASNDSEAETDSLSTVGQPSPERLRKLRSVEVMRGFTVKEHNPSVHTRAFFAFCVNSV
jgi:hypothetical protein